MKYYENLCSLSHYKNDVFNWKLVKAQKIAFCVKIVKKKTIVSTIHIKPCSKEHNIGINFYLL